MQELKQTLDEVKGLHERVLGCPAPELGPHSFIPFPPGVDPVEHARAEALHVKELGERVKFAPKPDAWSPLADSFVTEKAFVVRLEIAGVSREDVKVHIVGSECVVRGERKAPQCIGEMRPMALERPWGSFERRFILPAGSRVDEMSARCVDGLLELEIPKNPVELPKEQKIEVV